METRAAVSPPLAVGVDLGTSSARAVMFCAQSGAVISESVVDYDSRCDGVLLDPSDHLIARQDASSVGRATVQALKHCVEEAARDSRFSPGSVVGIGVDATASTPVPVDSTLQPLSDDERFRDQLPASAWLWKDHSSFAEAEELSAAARRSGDWFTQYGGSYSSEWFWAKVLRCRRVAPDVADAAATWAELSDLVPAWLCGESSVQRLARNICAAAHKSGYSVSGNGYPPRDFFYDVEPSLAEVWDTLNVRHYVGSERIGGLCPKVAEAIGLPAGIGVAAGTVDAHAGAIGAGVEPGALVKILGTSACTIGVSPIDQRLPAIPGLSGIVEASVIADHYGLEAGQAAFGDILAATVSLFGEGASHETLTLEAENFQAGETGLLALDWHNGNRSVLNAPQLSGAVLGLSLGARPGAVYRAMVEAICFGARTIIEQIAGGGVDVDRVIVTGGIALKNDLVLKTMASILGRDIVVASSAQAGALGAAINAAVAMGVYPDVPAAQAAMVPAPRDIIHPEADDSAVYDQLFSLYRQLHDGFGGLVASADYSRVMQDLAAIRTAVVERKSAKKPSL
ncbi:MAG: ribulokinase [Pseudomonadota bacterium]